jgi:hypothetical protein
MRKMASNRPNQPKRFQAEQPVPFQVFGIYSGREQRLGKED